MNGGHGQFWWWNTPQAGRSNKNELVSSFDDFAVISYCQEWSCCEPSSVGSPGKMGTIWNHHFSLISLVQITFNFQNNFVRDAETLLETYSHTGWQLCKWQKNSHLSTLWLSSDKKVYKLFYRRLSKYLASDTGHQNRDAYDEQKANKAKYDPVLYFNICKLEIEYINRVNLIEEEVVSPAKFAH